MLKFVINSYEIDFDGSISFRLLNPLFNDQVSHSFNIKTVNTDRIKDIIKQLHLPEVGFNQVQFSTMMVTDAFSFLGVIYFNSITGKYIDFQFNSQNDFWNKANVSLRSITLPFDAKYLPIKNSKFMENFQLTGNYCGFVNQVNELGVQVANETTAPVPSLRLNSIVAGIPENFNIRILRNDLETHADLRQLYMYNGNSNGTYRYRKWEGMRNAYFKQFYVTIEDEKYKFNFASKHELIDSSYCMIAWALIRPIEAQEQLIEKVFKVTVEDEYSISFDIKPVVTSLSGGPYSNQIQVTQPIYDGIIEEKAKNHLPEINCGDFLHEIEKLTASKIFIDESSNTCRIIHLKNILNSSDVIDISQFAGPVSDQPLVKLNGYKLTFENPSEDSIWSGRIKELTDVLTKKDPVATFSALPMTGNVNNDVRLVIDENAYYRYFEINFLRSSGWELYSENILKLQTGEGKYAIATKFSPLLFEKAHNFLFANIDKPGGFIIINDCKYEDFRLFFYRQDSSYRDDSNILHIAPLLNNDVYGGDGVKVGNLALRWDGEYGLHNQLHKEWIDLMINRYREETRFVNWPLWMLNSFAWWKKYRVNHMNYLVKSIDLDLSPAGTVIKDTVLVPVIFGKTTLNEFINEVVVIPPVIYSGLSILYNGYAVKNFRRIPNTGWRIPTSNDYNTLVSYLGGAPVAGGKLKEAGIDHWTVNTGGTNEFGFNGQAEGIRNLYGVFAYKNLKLVLHSGEPYIGNHYGLILLDASTYIDKISVTGENNGYSLRLIKSSTILSPGQTGTYVGNDGKIYSTICIGTQEWLSSNIAETKFWDGTTIPEVTDGAEWAALTTPGMCYYDNEL